MLQQYTLVYNAMHILHIIIIIFHSKYYALYAATAVVVATTTVFQSTLHIIVYYIFTIVARSLSRPNTHYLRCIRRRPCLRRYQIFFLAVPTRDGEKTKYKYPVKIIKICRDRDDALPARRPTFLWGVAVIRMAILWFFAVRHSVCRADRRSAFLPTSHYASILP